MPQLENRSKEQDEILAILEGDSCSFCEGTLVQGRYKGNDAIVCSECDTPTVQIW